MKLGLVTYNIAATWDRTTLIKHCREVGLAGVELRTTHAHGVEVDLSAAERQEVKTQFVESGVELVGLGSTFEFHSPDDAELEKNIEGTKEMIRLAADVGAGGVKVRPNAFPEGVSREQTIEQIGAALRAVGAFGVAHGVKIRLEVHGRGTSDPAAIQAMLRVADHPNVFACWNSNMTDVDENGSIDGNFERLRDRIEIAHINVLWNAYPWEELFRDFRAMNFEGFCLAEIPASDDPITVLHYYRRLFDVLAGAAD